MVRKLFKLKGNNYLPFIGLDEKAAVAIQEHFQLSNYQMILLSWLKGFWTGILLSLVLHYIFYQ